MFIKTFILSSYEGLNKEGVDFFQANFCPVLQIIFTENISFNIVNY